MHQTRKEASRKLPISRKGTKYVARAASHLRNSVPVVIAVRDMLKLAKTAREVKKMIQKKALKINSRPVKDYRDSIKLFNFFEADKLYRLSLLPTGKFAFEESNKIDRLCKVTGKKIVGGGKIQLNLHDGTNVLADKKSISTADSLYLDKKNNIIEHIPMEKNREVFIASGKHMGIAGKISSINRNKISVKLSNGRTAVLNKDVMFVFK